MVWVDKETTKHITPDGNGITVSILHTGKRYDDDLATDDVLYYYPRTSRPLGRDKSEVEATKKAGRFGLPVFVITRSAVDSKRRSVNVGFIENWDDNAGMFLVSFTDTFPKRLGGLIDSNVDESHFEPFVRGMRKIT